MIKEYKQNLYWINHKANLIFGHETMSKKNLSTPYQPHSPNSGRYLNIFQDDAKNGISRLAYYYYSSFIQLQCIYCL